MSKVRRSREPISCSLEARLACGESVASIQRRKIDGGFSKKVRSALRHQHIVASTGEQERFVEHLERSICLRQVATRRWRKNRKADDIIGLIQIARDSRDLAEAIWRCFLAAHFGRASAEGDKIGSASSFLCAFKTEPFWTWERVRKNPTALRKWLSKHQDGLQKLAYGNHRKYESKQADDIWKVIQSFWALAEEHEGPLKLVAIDPTIDTSKQFDLGVTRIPHMRAPETARVLH